MWYVKEVILLVKKMLKREGFGNGLGGNYSTNASKLLLANHPTVPTGTRYALLDGPYCILYDWGFLLFLLVFKYISFWGGRKYDDTFAPSK